MLNERFNISALENGYLVEYSYSEKETGKELGYRTYQEKKYMFADWEGVVKHITDNALKVPPKH